MIAMQDKYRFNHNDKEFTTVPDMLLYAMQNNEDLALCDENGNAVVSHCKLCNKIIEITTNNITFCVCDSCKNKLKKLLNG